MIHEILLRSSIAFDDFDGEAPKKNCFDLLVFDNIIYKNPRLKLKHWLLGFEIVDLAQGHSRSESFYA
jgi:hypothetical protein